MTLSAEQLAARAGRVGSSNIAAVLGENPWCTEFEAWLRITGRDPFEGNDATELGHWFEPGIATMTARKVGATDPIANTESRQVGDWGIATPDFHATFEGRPAIVEAKHVSIRAMHSWDENPETGLARYVMLQTQFQLGAFERELAFVGAVVAGLGPWVYRVDFDPALYRGMCSVAHEWWERYVVTDEPPPMDHSDGARQYTLDKFPELKRPELLSADAAFEAIAAKERELDLQVKALKNEQQALKNRIHHAIGDAAGLMTEVGPYKLQTYKTKDGTSRRLMPPRQKG